MTATIALLLGLLQAPVVAPIAWAEEPAEASAPMKDEDAGKPLPDPPLLEPPSAEVTEARTQSLAGQLRCPVCQGLSVAASPSEAARAMRDRVHELVGLGYSDEQIVDYFVGRYGTWVLLAPPRQGFTWLLWAGPGVAVAGGLLWVLSRAKSKPAAAPAQPVKPAPAEGADPYRARILAELGEGADAPREG